MLTLLLVLIPFLGGLLSFGFNGKSSRGFAFLISLATLAISILTLFVWQGNPGSLQMDVPWMSELGCHFHLGMDGMGAMLMLLTAIAYVIIFLASWDHDFPNANSFFGLMLLTEAGLMGVFSAYDALLFYMFWELVLIPVYFLSSIWGGEKRIQATFKFFVYTFLGSLLMLVGIIYLYLQTPGTHSFEWSAFRHLSLSHSVQIGLFLLLFVAFAIKMPMFPFHTWQPDTYEQAPTPVTMVLSAIMVKMGLFGVIRWVLPIVPAGAAYWAHSVVVLSVIGIVYASCLAIVQSDLKRLFAYASIAHMGLMCATLFSSTEIGIQGVMVQMFNHGIIILGLWIFVEILEQRLDTRNIRDLGGLATIAPKLAIAVVIVCLGNVALPLSSGFVGEFLMFSGLYLYSPWLMAVAGLGIILSAVYILGMIQKSFYGKTNEITAQLQDLRTNEWVALAIVIALIVVFGVYPKPMLNLVHQTTSTLMATTGN